MKKQWMSLFTTVLLLSLIMAPIGAVQAQDPQPPKTMSSPYFPPHYPPVGGLKGYGDLGKGVIPFVSPKSAQTESQAEVALGQPGLSFRYVQTFGTTGEPYLADGSHLNKPNGLFIDASNNLYTVEENGHRLLKFNAFGANTMILGHAGQPWAHDDFLAWPVDNAVDAFGNIWVVFNNAALKEFDSAGNMIQYYPAIDPWVQGDTNDRFNTPWGIAFDSTGLMYISDRGNHRIQVYDVSGGTPSYVETIGETGVPHSDNNGFDVPGQIAFDSLGRLYVMDSINNFRVQRCTKSGTWTCTTFFGETGVQGNDLNHLSWAFGITIKNDIVYIADGANYRVLKCTLAGVCSHVAGTNSVGGSDNSHFWWVSDVAVDSSGNVFVSDLGNYRIQKFNSAGVYQSTIGVTGVPYLTDISHINTPWGVAVNAAGDVFTVEHLGYRLLKFNSAGSQQWSVGEPGVDSGTSGELGGGYIAGPEGNPAIDAAGRVYVPDTPNNRVQIYDANGSYFTTLGTGGGQGNYEFSCPEGVAISPVNGDVYVADMCNQRILVYTSALVYKATLGETGVEGSDNSHFRWLRGVTVANNGNVFVADSDNHRIQKCNFTTGTNYTCSTFAGETGIPPDGTYDHIHPLSVAVDASSRVYAADEWNSRVMVYDSAGAFLTSIGGNWSQSTGGLTAPSGVAVDSAGNVYVTDRENHRIQKFAPGVPGWQQVNINGFGNPAFPTALSMAVFNNQLYAGAGNWSGAGASIWRTSDGSNWSSAMTSGFGSPDNNPAVIGMIVFNGQLYAGTGWGEAPGQLWRSSDGTTWNQITGNGMGVSTNPIGAFAVYNNTLYAGTCGTGGGTDGAQIWRSSTGDSLSWTSVVTGGNTTTDNGCVTSLMAFDGALYAAVENSVTGAQIWRSSTGNSGTWTQVNTSGFGEATNDLVGGFAVYNGYLYIGTRNSATNAELWRSNNGTSWNAVMTDGFGDGNNNKLESLFVFNGALYAGLNNSVTGLEVWGSLDGMTWNQINIDGFGDSNSQATLWSNETVSFNNNLYIGVSNGANGVEIWKRLPIPFPASWSGGASITADQNIVAVGRPHIGAEVMTYDGFSSGSLNAYVPMLFKDAFGGSYDSALYVQNLDAVNLAHITIKFYDSGGSLTHFVTDTLSPLASKGYWLPGIPQLGASWIGGVKVESDVNIVAVGRPHIGGEVLTYNSFASGSLNAYVPMLFKDAFGGSYDSALYVQNVDAGNAANITIKFYDANGLLTHSQNDTLAPLASKGYWLPGITQLGTSWIGGIKVESDRNIVAVGRPHIGSQVTTYNGFASGGLNVSVPMLFKDAFGGSYDSALYLQNLDPGNTANLTIKFYDANGALTYSQNDTLAPLASKGYWLPGIANLGSSWIGGVKVESDRDIVAVGRPHIGSQVTTYNGFTSGSVNVSVPMLFKDAFGGSYDSALYLQNVHPTSSAAVTIKFYDAAGNLSCVINDTLSALASKGYWLPSLTCAP